MQVNVEWVVALLWQDERSFDQPGVVCQPVDPEVRAVVGRVLAAVQAVVV